VLVLSLFSGALATLGLMAADVFDSALLRAKLQA
jgi:hypothetical protein